MDLIGAHPSSFIVTDHIASEITNPEQLARYAAALAAGYLIEERIDDLSEVEIFLRLARHRRLGAGERSAIAVAINRKCLLAIEDARAIRRALEEAEIAGNPLHFLRTRDIVVELIRRDVLTVEEADAILNDWAANHRFRMRIRSFRELL